jgi:hypothetical protein
MIKHFGPKTKITEAIALRTWCKPGPVEVTRKWTPTADYKV